MLLQQRAIITYFCTCFFFLGFGPAPQVLYLLGLGDWVAAFCSSAALGLGVGIDIGWEGDGSLCVCGVWKYWLELDGWKKLDDGYYHLQSYVTHNSIDKIASCFL